MNAREEAICLVNDCVQDICNVTDEYADANVLSYMKWSAQDILSGIIKTNKPALIFMEEYRDKMEDFYRVKNEKIFEIAGATAKYLIKELVSC